MIFSISTSCVRDPHGEPREAIADALFRLAGFLHCFYTDISQLPKRDMHIMGEREEDEKYSFVCIELFRYDCRIGTELSSCCCNAVNFPPKEVP
jgi:hypothetical protein